MIKDFKVPEFLDRIFKKPQGRLISESELAGLGELVAVGDEVTLTLLENGIKPRLAIIDYKVKRAPIEPEKAAKLKKFGCAVSAKNPAGSISLDAWNKIKAARGKSGIRLEIEGEEDLLALACFFLFPEGTKIIYGQPDEGIVLFEVTDKRKQEYANLLIGTAGREFLDSIQGKTVVLHHSDPDGLCSAAILMKYLKSRGIRAAPICFIDPLIHENHVNEISKQNPKNLLLLDFGGEAGRTIRQFSRKMNVLIIDHHHIYETDFGAALFLNPHLFELPENRICPTSALAFEACQTADWVAAIGIIGDKGEVQCSEFLKKIRKMYKVDFHKLEFLLDAADSAGKSREALDILLKAEKPEDLLKSGQLAQCEQVVSLELEQLLKLHREKGKWLSPNALFYEISSDFELRGAVANELQGIYPDKVVIVGEVEDKMFSMSFRTERTDIEFPSLIRAAIRGLKNAHGGGHAQAAGAKVRLKDKERFLENFIRALGVSN